MKRKKLKPKRGTIEFVPVKGELQRGLQRALVLIQKLADKNPYKKKP